MEEKFVQKKESPLPFDVYEPEVPLINILSETEQPKKDTNILWLPQRNGKIVQCQVWQILPSNFRFFFNGRVMLGPGTPCGIYIILLLIVVSVAFLVVDMLPYYTTWLDLVPGVLMIFFTLCAAYNLLRVILSDPGYILPHWCQKISNQYLVTSGIPAKDLTKEFGYTSYCRICRIFQRPGTFHCDKCHACIENLDHHCSMLGTCVGKRNFGYFFFFIICTNIALWIGLIISFIHLIQNWISHGPLYAVEKSVTLFLICSTMIVPPLGLYVLILLPFCHLRLMYRGTTVEEQVKGEQRLNTRFLAWHEKFWQFIHTFYDRVIKEPPPSQISTEILRLVVNMPAIHRTKLVNVIHDSVQTIPKMKKPLKIVPNALYSTLNMNLESVRARDAEIYRQFFVPIMEISRQNHHEKSVGVKRTETSPSISSLNRLFFDPSISSAKVIHKTINSKSNFTSLKLLLDWMASFLPSRKVSPGVFNNTQQPSPNGFSVQV